MKNLFAVNKTDSKNATAFDENPFLVARVSDEVRHKLEHAFDGAENPAVQKKELTPEEVALKRKSRILWGIGLVSLLGALGIFAIQGSMENKVLTVMEFALLIVSVIATFMARRTNQKLNALQDHGLEADFSVITDRLNTAAEEAARELGVPKKANNLEILPYHYKRSGDKESVIGKKGRFDNIIVSCWIDGDTLSLATAQELFRVPLAKMTGYRTIDEDFEVDFWLQEEEADSEIYKEFNIRSSGLMGKKCHGYYAVLIEGGYEFFVPCYDFSTLTDILPLSEHL